MVDFALFTKLVVMGWPLLSTARSKVVDGALAKLGEDGIDLLKGLLGKLRPGITANPPLQDSLERALQEPNNPDRQIVLKVALQDWLKNDPALLNEVATLLMNITSSERVKYQINAEKIYGQAVGENPQVTQYFGKDAGDEHS
jgi:hypothetical protein